MRPRKHPLDLGESGPSQIYQKLSTVSSINTEKIDKKNESNQTFYMINGGITTFKHFLKMLNKIIYKLLLKN